MDLLELWKRHLERTKSPRTVQTYELALLSFIKRQNIQDLRNMSVKDLYSYADSSGLSSTSLLTHFSAILHFYKFAFRRGYVDEEVYLRVQKAIEDIREEIQPRRIYGSLKALGKREIELIMQCTKNTKYEKVYSLLLYSGLRLLEYQALRKDFFQLDKSGILWIHLPAEATKGRKPRIVPILGATKEDTLKATQKILRWLEDFEENFRVSRGTLQVYTNRLSKRLNIPFSIHSFRHTYITNLINNGFSIEVVKEFAGHAHIKTTVDIYYRFSQERARRMVEEFLR
ncbi:tyrosine-type recombinase/integrase [Thermocrinis minervae]|uniref:Integrase/recombinase XerD n=1 Tax=Thermocrinis minervae TaxID=381751 RepID=A0A1M6QPT7_9AQUI|nr:site-specific integrase [Thermocrinis minervae]SHK22185.1 integrase/recombinase XerD [Thermocrinis minervae]